MPIMFEGGTAVLHGRCPVDEADALLDWLRGTQDPTIDLDHCDEVHTAIFQLLLASRARIVAPRDKLLADCLTAAGIGFLARGAASDNESLVPTQRRAHEDVPSPATQVQS